MVHIFYHIEKMCIKQGIFLEDCKNVQGKPSGSSVFDNIIRSPNIMPLTISGFLYFKSQL